jgi:hypothetical protein
MDTATAFDCKLGVDHRRLRVVDSHCDGPVRRGLGQKLLLYRRIVRHRAVAIDVIRRKVGQYRNIRNESGGQINLIGRNLQHIHRLRARSPKLKSWFTDISANLRIETTRLQDMADQRSGGGFAVRSGDRNDGRQSLGIGVRPYLPREQFDIADDLDIRFACARDDGVRSGMRQRYTGA